MRITFLYTCRLAAVTLMAAVAFCQAPGTITTVAGNGSLGNSGDGGLATKAPLGAAHGVAVDKAGNIYIADAIFNVVRKVDAKGIISTFAGGNPVALGDGGAATKARLDFGPVFHAGLAVDNAGNLYIADTGDSRVRKVDTSGTITTVAGNSTSLGIGSFSGDGGKATSAGLNSPVGVALDSAGNLYIADFGNNRIRKVDTSGKISTIAGIGFVTGSDSGDGGPATKAELSGISDVAVDRAGNVYIADQEHIRKINTSGTISTAAHGFFGTCVTTPTPVANADVAAIGLAVDSAGNLYMANHSVLCVEELDTNGIVTTVAGGGPNLNGDGGPATSAALEGAYALAFDTSGNLYIAAISKIRKVTAQVTPPANPPSFAATGVVNGASFAPGGVVAGEIATIFGSNLTSITGINLTSTLPLPTDFENVSVTVNGVPAPLFAVDNVNGQQQINFQVPWTTSSLARIQVTNRGAASPVVLVPVQISQPAIFNYTAGGEVFGAILHSNFHLADTADPAKAGETVLIYCTGLGFVSPLPTDGVAATGQKTMELAAVTIGGVTAPVSFSGLAPGFVGLYQVNAQVPAGLAATNQPVIITISGAMSKSVLLPVQ
jgi:uncharacterized protein (TIGR03437 family)